MFQPILLIADYNQQTQAKIDAVVGRRPAARSIVADIGGAQFNPAGLAKQLADCAADGSVPVLWSGPSFAALDAGTVDIAGLPEHPTIAPLSDALAAFGKPALVRLLFECANKRPDGSFRYGSGPQFVAAFDGIAAKLPVNAVPVWSYQGGSQITFAEWRPKLAKMADVSMYGKKPRSLSAFAGKNVAAFVQVVAALGLPLIVGESGHKAKDYPSGPTDEALKYDSKALLTWCSNNNVRALAGPFSSSNYGMTPWLGNPQTEAYLRKKLSSTAFVTKPLAGTDTDPLVAAGLVPA